MPWVYVFYGGSTGLTLDFKKILCKNFLNNPKNIVKGFGMNFSISVGISFFLVTANRMESPDDYTRHFTFWSGTALGVTASKAWGGKMSTYGVGFTWEIGVSKWSISIGKKYFGTSGGSSFYHPWPLGKNAKSLYDTVRGKVK